MELLEIDRITLKEPLYLQGVPPKDNLKSCKEHQLFWSPLFSAFVIRTLSGDEYVPACHVAKFSPKVELPKVAVALKK